MKLNPDNQTQSIGLHFDGSRIHGVRLMCDSAGARVQTADTVLMDEKPGFPKSIEALRKLLSNLAPPKGCRVYATTSFSHFYTTHLLIGEAPLKQMNKMARMAYMQEIHQSDTEIIFDYERIGLTHAVTPKVNLHAFSVEADKFDCLSRMLSDAGQEHVSLFPKLFAFRTLVQTLAVNAPVALLLLDEDELRFSVIHQGKYLFTRTFQSGHRAILDYISQKVDTPISAKRLDAALDAESEEYAGPLSEEIRTSFEFVMQRMQQQVERAFKFYSGRLKLPAVERVLLYADSLRVARNIAEVIRRSDSRPVEELDLRKIKSIELEDLYLYDQDDPYDYTLAIGAALASVHTCPSLLYTHDDQQQQRKAYRMKTSLVLALSMMGLACAVTFAAQVALLTPRLLKNRDLAQKAAEQPASLTRDLISVKTRLCKKRMHELQQLAEHYALQGCFYEITRLMPPELKLEHLHMERYDPAAGKAGAAVMGTLTLRGIVSDQGVRQQALLTKFLVELGGSSAFQNVSRIQIAETELDVYRELGILPFRISCDLVGESSSAPKGDQP